MRITVAERLKPFSHTPGAACLIPGTCWKIEAFPALIRVGRHELHLHINGPVKDFTLEQDLEKNCVSVFGRAKQGFYRLKFRASSNGIEVMAASAPIPGLIVNGKPLRAREKIFISEAIEFFLPRVWERLSLGMSKDQDWDLVLRRFDLKEILPVLFGLGQKIPLLETQAIRGTGHLLQISDLESFCRAAFSKILIPRLIDDQHQGLAPEEPANGDPCFLIQEAKQWIRGLFFRQDGQNISLLPACPFDTGRLIRLQAGGVGEIDLEWASKKLRRVILRPVASQEIFFYLQRGLHSFRIRNTPSQRGHRHNSVDPFSIEIGKTYFFDRFQ